MDLESGASPADMVSLELDDHRARAAPAPQAPATASRSSHGGARSSAPQGRPANPRVQPRPSLDAPSDDGVAQPIQAPIGTDASAAVAALLEGETQPSPDPTARVLLAAPVAATAPTPQLRTRTMTAARPAGVRATGPFLGRRPSRRQLVLVGAGLAGGVAVALVAFSDLPERFRGEPKTIEVLRPIAAALARDEYGAYADGARLLEEAVARRHLAPRTRAAAAELLAQSIVLHGTDRARAARAKALLESASDGLADAPRVLARALAWMALASGHTKDAEDLAAAPALAPGDRAVLLGWVALDRGDSSLASTRFEEAARSSPPPAPSPTATRFALARAREAQGSAEAAGVYRRVLADAPSHLGAALGLARVSSSLSPSARLKLARSALAAHAQAGARAELAAGSIFVAVTARQVTAGGDGATGGGSKASAEATANADILRARALDSGNPALAAWLGDALLWEGRYDEAVARYRSAMRPPLGTPALPILGFARAAALLESGRAAESRNALAELARRLPDDARVSFWLGRLAERAPPTDLATAERRYREALTRDPHFVPATLELARLLLDGHRATEALDVLKRAEAGGAGQTVTRLALGQAQLAAGSAAGAAATFRQVLATDANLAAARLGLSAALEATGDLEGAHAELVAIAAHGDVQPGLGARMASVLARLGRREEALAAYERAIAAGGASPIARVAAARLALTMGRKDRARALVTSVIDEDPRTPGALLVLAELSRADGNTVQAVADLRRALAVDGSAEVQLEFGRALAALGRDEEALAALEQAQSLPAAGIERGHLRLRRGDFEGAVRELTAALAKLPTSAEGFLWLGAAEDRLGHPTKAEAAWRSAVRLAPALAEARYRLGRLAMEKGQSAAALRDLRAAAERPGGDATVPWSSDLYFQLGFAEKRQGYPLRAQEAFRRYLALAPPDAPARAEVLRELGPAQIQIR